MNKKRIVTCLKKEEISVCSIAETFALEVNQVDQAMTSKYFLCQKNGKIDEIG
jgi:hypothetical protein